jgi:acyl-CoA thioesterase I
LSRFLNCCSGFKSKSTERNRYLAPITHMVMVFAVLCMALLNSPTVMAQSSKVLIVGDSLSAEYGLPRGTGWVKLLEDRLKKDHASWQVVNASISGETTAGGQTRLPLLLKTHQPKVVVIELGANDALRGLQLPATEQNLRKMIQASKQSGAKVLLLGMRIPPNYGQDYTNKFFAIYGKLATAEQVELLPFFLERVATRMDLFQADRIHPNVMAQSIMLENVWPKLEPLLKP